jgi:N-succinyldiaminopimelate aminotransferase
MQLAQRHGAVDLATGSPSFPAIGPDLVLLACAAIRSDSNQYADPAGSPLMRAAAAAVHGADPDLEITITSGATEGLNVVLQTLVQAGDEVVVLEPFYEAYPAAIRLAGAVPRFVRLHLDARISRRAR